MIGHDPLANADFSRPEVMYAALQSLFQTMGVKPVGVSGQPVASTGGSPWEAIKGCAGSSLPSRRLTEFDFSSPERLTPRSVRASLSEGGTLIWQNDLACTAPASGQQGDRRLCLDGTELLDYGLGARPESVRFTAAYVAG
jgi:hypothetical protein